MSEKLRSKVESQVAFNAATTKTFDELVELVRASATASKRMMQTTFKVGDSPKDGVIRLGAYGPGGLVEQMRLVVTHDDQGGAVSLEVGDFSTTRPTVAGFIPVGPKSVPGLGAAKRFATNLRQGL